MSCKKSEDTRMQYESGKQKDRDVQNGVYSVKLEVDTEPTVVQPPELLLLPCKPEPAGSGSPIETNPLIKNEPEPALEQAISDSDGVDSVKLEQDMEPTVPPPPELVLLPCKPEPASSASLIEIDPLIKNEPEAAPAEDISGSVRALSSTQYTCDCCGRCFVHKKNLKCHLITHTSERPHKLDISRKSNSLESHSSRNMPTRTGKRGQKCDICKKSLSTRWSLQAHMLTHAGERPYKCDVCKTSFKRKATLKQHMLTHTCERPHKCHVCKTRFKRKGTLDKHVLIHTDERLECCKKILTTRSAIKNHLKKHITHKCDICKKILSSKSSLRNHLLTHTKKLQCDICKKILSSTSGLINHLLIHTKTFQCDICKKSFPRISSLNAHNNIFHTRELSRLFL